MSHRLPTEERQAEIIAAALQLACNTSPPLITTAQVADAVGISQGAVFRHFASKEAIWLAALRWVRSNLLQALDDAAVDAPCDLDALAAMFEAHVGFVVTHPGVPRLIFHELQKPAETEAKTEVRALLQAYRQRLLRRLNSAAAQGRLRDGIDRGAAATLFVGMVQGLVMQAMGAGAVTGIAGQAGAVFALYRRALVEAA